MSTIVTRAGKSSPLTNAEVDSNFTNLNADKVETITSADGSVVVSTSGTTRDLSVGTAASTGNLISQVRNETGAALTKGTVVYISGAAGNKAVVSKALASGDSTSAQTYGMVQADIPNNQNGYVVVIGSVSGLNTSAFTDGAQLYLSGTTAGTYTSTKPYAPTHLVYVGIVTYSHATQGTIQVKIQNGYELDELHDVSARSPTNGDTLVYNSTTSLWTKTAQSSLSVASAAAVPFSGVTGKPTTLAGYGITDAASSSHTHSYLPLSGGDVTGKIKISLAGGTTPANFFEINNTAAVNGNRAGLQVNTGSGWSTTFYTEQGNWWHAFGSDVGDFKWGYNGTDLKVGSNTVIHAGNYGSYALPLSGGTMSGVPVLGNRETTVTPGDYVYTRLTVTPPYHTGGPWYLKAHDTGGSAYLDWWYGTGNVLQLRHTGDLNAAGAITQAGNQVLHAGNYSSYALPLSGGTMTGQITMVSGTPWQVLAPGSGTYNKYVQYINGSEYTLEAAFATDSISGSKLPITFTWRGGYAATGGLQLTGGSAATLGGSTVLHAGNYTSYSPSLSGDYINMNVGGLYSRYSYQGGGISDATTAYALSPNYGTTTVAMHGSHGYLGGYATTLTMSGYERYGATQISAKYNATTPALAIRNYNQDVGGWNSWVGILSSANYSSYALPLSGGSVSGKLILTGNWGGSPNEQLSIRGQYPSMAFRSTNQNQVWLIHNDGNFNLYGANDGNPDSTAWTQRLRLTNAGALDLSGNTVLHAGNYSSYALPLGGGTVSGQTRFTGHDNQVVIDGTTNGTSSAAGLFFSLQGTPKWEFYHYSGRLKWYSYTTGQEEMSLDNSDGSLRLRNNAYFGGQVSSSGNNGFANATWYAGVRNPIWYFGNASTYGISYFQGSSGIGGSDTIGIHPNGTASAGGSSFAVGPSTAYVTGNAVLHAGNYSSYAVAQSEVAQSGASKVLRTGSNGYLYIDNWMRVDGGGMYSGTNSAHIYPNNGSYGAWKIDGTRNGYNGIEFGSLNSGSVSLMVYQSSNETGFHNNAYGWQFRWSDGTLYCHKNSYGAGTAATVLDSSNYSSYSPSLGGSGASGTWGINITGNASTVGSKSSSVFHQRAHFGTQDSRSSGYYKVRILPATSWMLSFIVRIYQGYESYDIRISGYNYGGSYWYSPQASLMDATSTAIDVRFGYDSAYNLWVAFPASNYTGLDVVSVVNGYTQFDGNYADQFAIQYEASLSGSVQTTVTTYRPVKMNEGLTTSNYTNYSPSLGGSGASGTWYINVTGSAGSADRSNYATRLHRRDDGSDYNVQTYWTGSYWRLYGYYQDSGHADVQVGYANDAGNAANSARASRANGNFYIDDNYGCGVVGTYSSYRYQGVFAMGDSYKLPADGTTVGNLYGMAWSHPNAGGTAGNLSSHGLLLLQNGSFMCALSTSIVASGNVTAYSDERLKTNWRDMPENYVARLAQVKVGIYDRLDEEELMTQVGVSAQSFQKLLPQAIMTAKDEMKTLSVSYGNAALASAVELAKDNVELRARIERLESLINKLIGD